MITRLYRNDNDKAYFVPGLGEIRAGERISFSGEFPPAINLANFPGLVDVHAEEEAGNGRDYEVVPEVITHSLSDEPDGGLAIEDKQYDQPETPSLPPTEPTQGVL